MEGCLGGRAINKAGGGTNGGIVARKEIFQGRLLRLVKLELTSAGGKRPQRECIEHPGAVVVLPVLPDGSILFVEQYRPAVDEFVLELPAGLREEGEAAIDTGIRELAEETGYKAAKVTEIGAFYTSAGYSNEKIILLEARGLCKETETTEEGITAIIHSKEEIAAMLQERAFIDAKTIIGLLYYFLQGD